jgi:sialic acid synthase SpsE
MGTEVALGAVAMGAAVLEKHFTLDRTLPGPDHLASLEPGELAQLVRGVRLVESARGTGEKRPSATERAVARVARRSLYWREGLAAGRVVRREDLMALRPGDGLCPSRLSDVIGRVLKHAVAAGTKVELEALEEAA